MQGQNHYSAERSGLHHEISYGRDRFERALDDLDTMLDDIDVSDDDAQDHGAVTSAVTSAVTVLADEFEAMLAELDNIDTSDKPANFVNPTPRRETLRERLLRHGPQGFAVDPDKAIQPPENASPLVRPLTTPLSPTLAPSSIPSPSPTSAPSRTTPKAKRHPVDLQHVGSWFDILSERGPVLAITVNFPDTMADDAWTRPNFLDWLRRKIDRRLKARLGYVPLAAWSIGIDSKGGNRPHLHGMMTLPAELHRILAEELLLAVGKSQDPHFRSRQVQVKPAKNAGWALYCLQNSEEADRAGINGKNIVASGELKKLASEARNASKQASEATAKIARRNDV